MRLESEEIGALLCFDVYSERAIKRGGGGRGVTGTTVATFMVFVFFFLLGGGERHVFLSDLESDKDAAAPSVRYRPFQLVFRDVCVSGLSARPNKTFADKCLN